MGPFVDQLECIHFHMVADHHSVFSMFGYR